MTDILCQDLTENEQKIWERKGLAKCIDSVPEAITNLKVTEKYADSKVRQSWSTFYALKELIDLIMLNVPDEVTPYFRGQNGDWELTPTILRDSFDDQFRDNFEEIYRDIARKYPSVVQYHEYGDDRVKNLAELQHYGMGTPLVDVTKNPFIAMLFMVDGFKKGIEKKNYFPRFEIFFIKNNGRNKLFQEVEKNNSNLRIDAQKGAFLNFDRLLDDTNLLFEKSDESICRIVIRIKPITPKINSIDELLGLEKPDNEDERYDGYTDKQYALLTATKDIETKLKSYHYTIDNLFPDFYMYLDHLKTTYQTVEHPEPPEWYKFNPNKEVLD